MIKSISLFLSGVIFTIGAYLVLHTTFPVKFETMKAIYNQTPSDKLPDLGKIFQTKWQDEVKNLLNDKSILKTWKKIKSVNLIYKSEHLSLGKVT